MHLTRRRAGQAMLSAALPAWARAAAAAEGDIVIGQIGPFTGIPVPDATQLNQGIKASLAQLNAKGGVNGRKLAFFELDDTYTPDGFVKAFKEAMARKPVALLAPVGSASLKRMLDDKLLDGADVIVLNAVPGAEALRNPGHPKFFHVRAGDKQQIEKMVAHVGALGISRLGVLHQNIPIGSSGLAVAKAAAGSLELVTEEAPAELPAIAAAAGKVVASRVQAVLVLGAPRFSVDGVAALRQAGMAQFIFTLSYIPPALLVKVAGAGARGVAQAQTFPNPMGVALPLQREFQAGMKALFPEVEAYTSFHLEGYLTARVFAEAARRSKDVTPDTIARSLHAMGEVDLGGFRVNFARGNVGSQFVDIGVINADGRLVY